MTNGAVRRSSNQIFSESSPYQCIVKIGICTINIVKNDVMTSLIYNNAMSLRQHE